MPPKKPETLSTTTKRRKTSANQKYKINLSTNEKVKKKYKHKFIKIEKKVKQCLHKNQELKQQLIK